MRLVDVGDLVPYARNARTHSAEQIKQIQASIREFGFVNPIIIDNDYNVLAGHGRIMAARAEGIEQVPCVFVGHLTDAQKQAYILADNRLAELAGWDEELLKIEISELRSLDFDINIIGFYENDVDVGNALRQEVVEDGYSPEVSDVPVSKRGDIYALNEHRVMCGDSTSREDWDCLMRGSAAALVVTDPPYNMSYEGAGGTSKDKRKSNKILNDSLSDEEFHSFIFAAYKNIRDNLMDGGSFYIFYKELGTGVFLTTLKEAGLTFKQELIWVKNQIVLGGAKYQNMYEPFLFGCKGTRVGKWNASRRERSVIDSTDYMSESEMVETIRDLQGMLITDVLRERKNTINDLHPTMKPIKLLARLIGNSSSPGDIVVDCFGGSGSTLIACEQLKRKSYTMEYDPRYVDVIINRWETLTGQKAVKL